MKLAESQLFTSDPKLIASLFTFLFDLEISIDENNVIYFILEDKSKLLILKKNDINNYLKFNLDNEYLNDLANKVELFNYKNNSNVTYNASEVKLNEFSLFSVI
jgi:hypothetical protein